MDTQLLNISKEELSLKRKFVEQLEKSGEDFNLGINKVFSSILWKILVFVFNKQSVY